MSATPNHQGANNRAFKNHLSVITWGRCKIAVHTVFERTRSLGQNWTAKRSYRINVGCSESRLDQGTSNQLFGRSATTCQAGEDDRGHRSPYPARLLVTNEKS